MGFRARARARVIGSGLGPLFRLFRLFRLTLTCRLFRPGVDVAKQFGRRVRELYDVLWVLAVALLAWLGFGLGLGFGFGFGFGFGVGVRVGVRVGVLVRVRVKVRVRVRGSS